jgi:hypothetical protein
LGPAWDSDFNELGRFKFQPASTKVETYINLGYMLCDFMWFYVILCDFNRL